MDPLGRSRLTGVPLRAPAGPLNPLSLGQPRGFGGWFRASRGSHSVRLGQCADLSPPPAIHRAVAPSRRCDGSFADLSLGLTYGGRRYPSRSAALASLRLPRSSGTPRRVALGYGVRGKAYQGGELIDWTLDRWVFRVTDYQWFAASGGTLAAARQVVAFVHAHPLPHERGRVLFAGSCGEPVLRDGPARLGPGPRRVLGADVRL